MTTEKYSPNSSQQPLAFTQVVNKQVPRHSVTVRPQTQLTVMK